MRKQAEKRRNVQKNVETGRKNVETNRKML